MRKRILFFLFVLAGVTQHGFSQSWELVVTAYVENNGFFDECTDPRTYYGNATFGTITKNYYEPSESSPYYATFTFTGTGAPPTTGVYISLLTQACTHNGTRNYDGPSPYVSFPVDVSNCNGSSGAGEGSNYNTIPPYRSSYIHWGYTFKYPTTLSASTSGNTCADQEIILTGTEGFSSYAWQFATSSSGPWTSFATTTGSFIKFKKNDYSAIPYNQAVFFRYVVSGNCTPPNIPATITFYPAPPAVTSIVPSPPACPGNPGKIKVTHPAGSIPSGITYVYTVIQLQYTGTACPSGPINLPSDTTVTFGYCPLFKGNASNDIDDFTVESDGKLSFELNPTTIPGLTFTPGKYLVRIEASGAPEGISCFESYERDIADAPEMVISGPVRTVPLCKGGNDGTATFTVSNGVGAFTCSDPSALVEDRKITITKPAGTYSISITDQGCTKTKTPPDFTIDPNNTPLGLSIATGTDETKTSITCYNSTTGKGDAFVTINVGSPKPDATTGYRYAIFPGEDTTSSPAIARVKTGLSNKFTNLGLQKYTVGVIAPNGCANIITQNFTTPPPLNGDPNLTIIPACFGKNDAKIEFTQTSGSTDLTFEVDGIEKTASPVGSVYTINDVPQGSNMTLVVYDNCLTNNEASITSTKTYTPLTIGQNPRVSFDLASDITDNEIFNLKCFGDVASGSIVYQDGRGPYNVNVTRGSTYSNYTRDLNAKTINFPGLQGDNINNYNVSVTDACTDNITREFSVLTPSQILATLTPTNLTCRGNQTGKLEVRLSGGVPGPNGDGSGNYVVTLYNDSTNTIVSTTPLNCNPSDENCFLFTGLDENIPYRIDVRDFNPNGFCFKSFDTQIVRLTSPGQLGVIPVVPSDLTGHVEYPVSSGNIYSQCKDSTKIALNPRVSGGTGPFTFYLAKEGTPSWPSPYATSSTGNFTGLGAGNYRVDVSDANNCASTSDDFQILEASAPVMVESITAFEFPHGANTKCHNTPDGSITIEASGGVGNYTYFISSDVFSDAMNRPETTNTFTNLAAKKSNGDVINYTIALRDTLGCPWTMTNGVNHELQLTTPDTVKFSWAITSDIAPGYEIPCRDDEATIRITSDGGHFPHHVTINTATQTLSNEVSFTDFFLTANTYTASFTDDLGCPAPDQTIVLNEPASHVAATAGTISFPVCVGNSDGQIEVSAVGGIPFPNPNEFMFLIRDADATDFDTDTLRGTNVTFFRPANYFATKDYEIMSIDAHGCSDTIPVTMTVNPNPLTLTSVEQVSPSCYGGTDGYITVTASNHDFIGGTSLRFKLSGGHLGSTILDTLVNGATVTFNNLQGTDLNGYTAYRAWVEDANACQDTAYQYLDNLLLPSFEPMVASLVKSIRPSCFNGTDGSLLVKISGGVPPYQYSLDNVTFSPVNPVNNLIPINNLEAGTYTFYVIDSNFQPSQPTCLNTTPFDVEPGRFIRLETNPSAVSCVGGNDGAIDLTVNLDNRASGENFESGRFSLFWTYNNLSPTDPISVQEDLTGLAAGRYTVHATYDVDSLICTNQASTTIQQPGNGAFKISNIVTYDAACGGLTNNGMATVNITGGWTGIPNYYRLDNTGWTPFSNSSFLLQGLSPGTHSIEISQSDFECNDAASFTIGSASIELTLQQIIKPSCPLNADGKVVLSSSSTNVVFAIQGDAFQSLGVFTGLAKGTYRFIAQDNTLTTCQSEVLEVVVDDPIDCGQGPLSLLLGATSPATCATVQDGQAEVIASGGVPPYQFYWDGSTIPTSSAIDDLAPGSHTVTVTDAVGASVTETVVIDILGPITFQSFTNRASCAASCDGTAALLIEGGSENHTIAWPGGFTGSTRVDLCAGQYDFTISDVRNPECIVSGSVLIEPYPDLQIDLITARPPVCPGGTDGYLLTDVTGGSGDYTITWNNSIPGERLEGQIPGDHTIAVTDNVLGCTKQMTFTLPDATPISVLSATVTAPKCAGGTDGKIVLDLGNVSSPLVLWDNGQIGLTASGLKAGTYGYTITGANGCSITGSETVEDRPALTVTASSTMPTCFNFCNGSAAIEISGGMAPYGIRWSHGPRTSSIVNLCAGTYSYTVTDNLNCKIEGTIVIDEPAEINITKTSDVIPACYGDSNGSIAIEANGGTGTYNYSWDSGQTTASITNLTAGDYVVTVRDGNQCSRSKTFSLQGPAALVFQKDKMVNPSCQQSTDGKIIPNPIGGTSPLTFSWNDQSTTSIKENLSAGQYTLRVADAKGCTVQKTYTLQAPQPLAIVNVVPRDPLCFNDQNGSISIEPIGGTAPYKISWNTNATTTRINDLGAGEYTLTVTDNNGCTSVTSYTLDNPDQLAITGIPEEITICIGSPTTVEPEGEWSQYQWTGPQNFKATTKRIETSLSGAYTLNTLNLTGCPAETNFTIEASKDALIADFLRLTEAVVYEPVVFVDISTPQPATIQWITPDNNDVVVNKQSKENIEIVFTRSGTFEIGMIATMGTCRSEIYKTVVVAEADENPDNSGGRMAIEDRPMSALVYPNPAREEIAIQIAVPSRDPVDIWLISPVENRAFFHERNQGQFDYLIEWNISKLTTGVYHLIYKQNNTTRSERIAVIR